MEVLLAFIGGMFCMLAIILFTPAIKSMLIDETISALKTIHIKAEIKHLELEARMLRESIEMGHNWALAGSPKVRKEEIDVEIFTLPGKVVAAAYPKGYDCINDPMTSAVRNAINKLS